MNKMLSYNKTTWLRFLGWLFVFAFLIFVYIFNGIMAVGGVVVSAMVLIVRNNPYGWVAMVISLFFTFSPLIVNAIHSNFIEKNQLYIEILDTLPTVDARECQTLPTARTSEFYASVNDVVGYCSGQKYSDMRHTTNKLMSAMLGVYSAEYSLLSSFISPAQQKNQCIEQTRKVLSLCPELRLKINQHIPDQETSRNISNP